MRALVTGAGGFVGRYLIEHLQSCGDQVIATSLSDPRELPAVETLAFDVTDPQAAAEIVAKYRPEVIYHLAGISFVPEAESDFEQTLKINVLGTHNLARFCHLTQSGSTLVLISSGEVYGRVSAPDLPLTEQAAVAPANNYALSKAMAELALARYGALGQMRGVVVRAFNHIGPGQDGRFVAASFASQLAQIARQEVPPVIRVGNLEAKRDFTDVRDIVRGYRLAALKGHGVYNLGSGRAVAIKSLLHGLIDISGLRVEISEDPARMRAAEVPEIRCSYERAKRELGWEPQYDLRQTLEALYQSCLKM